MMRVIGKLHVRLHCVRPFCGWEVERLHDGWIFRWSWWPNWRGIVVGWFTPWH